MEHIPVLQNQIIESFDYLKRKKSDYFIDGTLGAGGHSLAIATKFKIQNSKVKIIGIDKDQNALNIARENIQKNNLYENFILFHDDFKNIKEIINENNIENQEIIGALIDLGVSSMQLDNKNRGFSFQDPGVILDMRMNQNQALDAKEVLNRYTESDLSKILWQFGEEKFAKNIAKNICLQRKTKAIETVGDLLKILEYSIPNKIRATSRKHFATKTFQALRIEVNKELVGLDQAIKDFVDLLSKGSKLAIITFHSLEDRIVKTTLKELENPCRCPSSMPCICGKKPTVKIITKKPIIAEGEEIAINPRSRSAKLRIVEKLPE